MIEIIPTVVPQTSEDIATALAKYSFCGGLHIDVAAPPFAPNATWLPEVGYTLLEGDHEAHLMLQSPLEVGRIFAGAGVRRIVAHVEAFDSRASMQATFEAWTHAGAKEVCLGALFSTPLEILEQYISLADSVLLMTIASIGVQGIPFEERALSRVEEFHSRYPDVLLAVDGGVSEGNIASLAHAGARRFSVGSALARASDPRNMYETLKSSAESAIQSRPF